VLLGLQPVIDCDPDAIVAITPSDHGVIDGVRFSQGLAIAIRHAHVSADPVVFGVEPTDAHDDYGWITPAPPQPTTALRPVRAFVEKPSSDVAAMLQRAGAVWNTMVLVTRASVLRELYDELQPSLARAFDQAGALDGGDRAAYLGALYASLPRCDFSHDILTHARNLSTYVWPASMGWSDLGTPARLRAWQRRFHAAAGAGRRRRVSAA
jgi:mannose-1-phosphate guanylyltransferase